MGNQKAKVYESVCIGDQIYGTIEEPFWENEDLKNFVKEGENAHSFFFTALTLCNEYSVEVLTHGAEQTNRMKYSEKMCYQAAEHMGLKLAELNKENPGFKEINFDQEKYPEKASTKWAILYVIGAQARRGRITVVLSEMTDDFEKKGDVMIFSTGKRAKIMEKVNKELCQPHIDKTRDYFQAVMKQYESAKKKKLDPPIPCYYAFKTMESEEWEKLEEEYQGDGKTILRGSLRVEFLNKIEEDMILIGCVSIDAEGPKKK